MSPHAEAVRRRPKHSANTTSLLLFCPLGCYLLQSGHFFILSSLFFLGRSPPSLPPAVSLLSAVFPALPLCPHTLGPCPLQITEGYFQPLEEFKEEKDTKKIIKVFVCFHAGGLRSHVYLTGSLCQPAASYVSCHSRYLCRSSPPALPIPPPSLPSLGTTPIRALSFSPFPAPGVPWGLQWLGYSRRPISGFSPNRLISRQEVGSGGGRIPRGFSSC